MPIAIVAGNRTAFTKAKTTQRNFSAIELATGPVNALVSRYALNADTHGLLVWGTVLQHPDISNVAREIALESSLYPQTPAFSVIMACATSLACVAEASRWIQSGSIKWALAGGSESMSQITIGIPMKFPFLPKIPRVAERTTGLSMGEHCELMNEEWKISREKQDKWAVMSHSRAYQAREFHQKFLVNAIKYNDNLVRRNTSLEKIKNLPPVFSKTGTVSAANASPLTDGGAVVLLADTQYAQKKGWPILALLDDFEIAAVDLKKEGLLMAPAYATLRLLKRQNLKLADFDVVEIHEAFAVQVLCYLEALQNETWCLNRVALPSTKIPEIDKINPSGGSVALGHPFGATGARLVMQLAQTLSDSKLKSGLISICAAGGLGMVATLRSYEI